MKKSDLPKGTGHRKRLRKRFLHSGFDGFLDYEIIELLLSLGTPRRDCKQIAKEVIKKFNGLEDVLNAQSEELQKIKGIGPSNIFGLKLFQAVSQLKAKVNINNKILLNSATLVADYLQKTIGIEKKEHFVLLCLNSRSKLIKIFNISIGSLNSSIVHPRELFKVAIQSSAAQILIGHNHPSDDPYPSPEDIAITRRIDEAANIIGIKLLDHIIVTKNGFSSLRKLGMI